MLADYQLTASEPIPALLVADAAGFFWGSSLSTLLLFFGAVSRRGGNILSHRRFDFAPDMTSFGRRICSGYAAPMLLGRTGALGRRAEEREG